MFATRKNQEVNQETDSNNELTLKSNIKRFLLVGFSKTALDIALFYLFANVVRVSFFSLPPRTSALFITCPIIMTLAFIFSNYYVYKSSKKKRRTFIPWVITWILNGFVIQGIIIQFVWFILIHIPLISFSLELTNLLSKMFGVGVTMILNFIMNYFIFKKSSL